MVDRNLLNGKRVLLVDDEVDVLQALKDLLPMCDTVKASSFEEAKEILENQYLDMAVLDIMGVDGYKLLEIARERKVIPVMLTAHALSREHLMRSYKEGAASYVPKEKLEEIPVFLNDILEARQQGKDFWWRFMDRLGAYFRKRFGPEWQKEMMEELKYRDPTV